LGSIISETIVDLKLKNCELKKIGVPDTFTFVSGDIKYIRDLYGLSPEKIADTILKELKND